MAGSQKRPDLVRWVEGREEALRRLLAAEDLRALRIAQMLHDHVGQYVPVLQLELWGLKRELETGTYAPTTLQSLHAIAQNVGEELHKVALQLRPPAVHERGLIRSLTTFLAEWSAITKMLIELDPAGWTAGRARQLESDLFRVIRDLLYVVPVQAGARVHVRVWHEAEGASAEIRQADARQGVRADGCEEFLASVKARVAFLRGRFVTDAEAGSGETLKVWLPADHPRRCGLP